MKTRTAAAILACTLAACIDGRSPAAPTPPPAVPPVAPPPPPRPATVEIRNASIGYHRVVDALGGYEVERLTGTLANTGVDLDGVQLRMELRRDGELVRTREAWGSPRPLLAGDTLSFSFRTGQVITGLYGVPVINTSRRDVDLFVSALGSQTVSCSGWSSRARPSAVSSPC